MQNYRPISLLPLPGKIVEKLMHKQLLEYIEINSLITDNQHGFRKEHSCIHSIAQLTDFVGKKMDAGYPTLAAFVDFRKAFDCVQHPILLRKLTRLGLHDSVVKWFSSYLSDRKQRVLANNVYSSYLDVKQGVPQGSVLGPLFYILYANDIVDVIKHCKIALYADDTVLYTANSDFGTSMKKMRNDMDALSDWCGTNGIRMNTDKSKLMLFGTAKKLQELPDVHIRAEDTLLQSVSSYKYLGVTLDSQLTYKKHINKTISTASLKIRQLCRMRAFLNTKAATLVYKNMILPIIEYGDIFLTGVNVADKKKLQMMQNKGLRCALNVDRYTDSTEVHRDAGVLKLRSRRKIHLLNFMYDMTKIEGNLKEVRKVGVSTRSSLRKLFKLRRPRTEKYKKCFSYVGPKSWNALPEHIQQTSPKSEFKCKVAAHVELGSIGAAAQEEGVNN